MQVRKRSGLMEAVSFDKILNAVTRQVRSLKNVDPAQVAMKAVNGMFDGITTRALDELCARACADSVIVEPEYAVLGGRILVDIAAEDVKGQGIKSFSDSLDRGIAQELVSPAIKQVADLHVFYDVVDNAAEPELEVIGAYTVVDRYLLKDRETRLPIETPKQWLARVALGVAGNVTDAFRFFGMLLDLCCLPSTPTLFNAGTVRPQMSSCFLMDSPEDSLTGILKTINDGAQLGKYAGGIAGSISGVRGLGSHIKGTNGQSNGIMPWLKIDDAAVGAVNQGGKRNGAKAWYCCTWHLDVEDFLEARNQEGDMNRRTFNLNLANWVPDLFMQRVLDDGMWTLMDPAHYGVAELRDMHGDMFKTRYENLEQPVIAAGVGDKAQTVKCYGKPLLCRRVSARALFEKMMKTLGETGNGWMCWSDRANALCNQTYGGHAVHSSNLCTEILEVTKTNEWVAVCNLLSMNLVAYCHNGQFDFDSFNTDVEFVIKMLDNVIDKNFYTIPEAKSSNHYWRPVGLGVMGLTDAFHELGMTYGDEASHLLNRQIFETMYFHALNASCNLAKEKGRVPAWNETWTSQGKLHFERWHGENTPEKTAFIAQAEWDTLKAKIAEYGLRNSLLIAVAPTATIGMIAGVSECTEVMQQLAMRRETMGGDFLQVCKYAVRAMQDLGLWDEAHIAAFKQANGSIQAMADVPEAVKERFRTAFEVKQREIINMAAERAPFIDQSQSMNLFVAQPTVDVLSSMYIYAWQRKLKTTYYLRRRPPTEIMKTVTADIKAVAAQPKACLIDDPTCEACQ